MSSGNETHEFKAEVNALLKLVTNSLYTHSEIFLRELISNASDALDKARFEALVDDALEGQDLPREIRITADRQRKVLIIEDTGIGMTREEAARNLGTIAHSGTLHYLQESRKAKSDDEQLSLIGQFGVGFYSAFMVADRVTVHTRSARPGNQPVLWSSTGDGAYELHDDTREQRGTRIELDLKEESLEFLDRGRLRGIIRRYSNYVVHPILFQEIDEHGHPVGEAEQINSAAAFWARSPSDLTDEDYATFYQHVMGGFVLPGDEPLVRLHFSMDAPLQFSALLFVPGRAPVDLFAEDRKGLQLFARRVLIMDSTDKLLPAYLRFFRGVVDSQDLPLNVSREMLQEHKSLSAIRRQLTRKALKALKELAQDEEKYARFWREFGAVLKEGLHSDGSARDDLLELTRFLTINGGDELRSLAAYVEAMPEGQEAIYYIAGEDGEALRRSPHLEAARARGWDVLVMTDPVDEWVIQSLGTFQDKPFRSVTQGDLEGASDAEAEDGDTSSPIDPLLAKAREVLGDRVQGVRASKRLTDSAACLVDAEGALSSNMARILRQARQQVASRPRVLELNPDHPVIKRANDLALAGDSDRLAGWIEVLLDLASLAEGMVPDPAGTVQRVQALLAEVAGD